MLALDDLPVIVDRPSSTTTISRVRSRSAAVDLCGLTAVRNAMMVRVSL